MSTNFLTKEKAETLRSWVHVDATGQTLGRLASEIATIIRGKNKPTYTPHVDDGDFVVVTNAEKIVLTGEKRATKQYIWHSQFPGGLKQKSANVMLETKPERLLKIAVEGMLPATPLARRMVKKLKIYTGSEHPHKAQNPETVQIKNINNS